MAQDNETKPYEELPVTSEMRLSLRQWAIVLAIVTLIAVATPGFGNRSNDSTPAPITASPTNSATTTGCSTGVCRRPPAAKPIVVLGDSVVWGEYVKSDGTLPHFLKPAGRTAGPLRQRRGQRAVSRGAGRVGALLRHVAARPQSDRGLQSALAQQPQGRHAEQEGGEHQPCLARASVLPAQSPAYQADANERLSAVIERNVGFLGWVNHLQDCYFQQQSIPEWTLAEDPDRPAALPQRLQESAGPNHAGGPLGRRRRRRARPGQRAA